jgi:acetylornithine/succinyldiaminopimelate/putrescine aminotransferase/predicted amino acid dehydrogenase
MRFGFLAHATSHQQRNAVRAGGVLAETTGAGEPGARSVRLRFEAVTSGSGHRCTGEIRYLPYTAEELLARPQAARQRVLAEVTALAGTGARLVGLGGATSIVGDRGRWTARRAGVPVTSGNSLTAYSAWRSVLHIAALLDLDPADTRVGVLGYPGAIGLAVARLLLQDGFSLSLVHRPNQHRDGLLRHLPLAQRERVTLCHDLTEATAVPRLLVAASSVGGLVDPARLPPGSVVVDVALPHDVAGSAADRPDAVEDVVVVDGGLMTAEGLTVQGGGLALTRGINGCLAETLVLALDGRAEALSLGRELDLEGIRRIGDDASRLGLRPSSLSRLGHEVPDDDVVALRRHHRRPVSPRTVTDATTQGFRRFVNPPLARLYEAHGMDRVFTRGSGSTLVTETGEEYLDMVAGFGCLNLGHNHPTVARRLGEFLAEQLPTFVQYVSLPTHNAELSERLCELAPGRMRRVFLSSSGAEAVEAALKLARAATGRARLVHVHNGFHGKTLGALSVTGRASHRERFEPLLPDSIAVPFGDVEALEAALPGAAAFIVEPILGEGGVIEPPPGYLEAAQRLCRRTGAVFVVDEIQTGLGRTGRLFASEGLEPDVLCLAKSLSGGLVPIGATLATAEVWDAAYGDPRRAVLHTSTFGGGNLAAAAGLATLDVLADGSLVRHAAAVGDRLRSSLLEVAARHSFVAEVRGRGLMNAVAFDADLDGALTAVAQEVLARLPGDATRLLRLLPGESVEALRAAGRAVESTLADALSLSVVGRLAKDHRILTFVTANDNRVLRLQPPLVLTWDEADRFVAAFDAVCDGLALHSGLGAHLEHVTEPTPHPSYAVERPNHVPARLSEGA